MKLTEGALSMLLKRYRAVLGKCRALNWLAGVVLAGGIVLGTTCGVMAANFTPGTPGSWDTTTDITNTTTNVPAGTYTFNRTALPTDITDPKTAVGIIFGSGVSLTIQTDVKFENSKGTNGAPNSTGLIYNDGGILVIANGAKFTGNVMSTLGVVVNTGTKANTIGAATFSGNVSTSNDAQGGALTNFGTLTITDATFSNNSTSGRGGAIYNSGTLTLAGKNNFSGNSATVNGKDIFNAAGATLNIAIDPTVTNLGNDDNETHLNSGIYNLGIINIQSANVTVGENQVLMGAGLIGSGLRVGGLLADAQSQVNVANKANLDFGSKPVTLLNTQLASAAAPGAISLVSGATLLADNLTISKAATAANFDVDVAGTISVARSLTNGSPATPINFKNGTLALGNAGSGQNSSINGSLSTSGSGAINVNSGEWTMNNGAILTIGRGTSLTIGGSVDKDSNPIAAVLNLTKQGSVPAGSLINNGTVTIDTKGELSLAGIGGLLGTGAKVNVKKGGVLDFGGVESTLLSTQLAETQNVTGKIWLDAAGEGLGAATLIADKLIMGDKDNAFSGGTPGIINVSLSLKDGKGTGITWNKGTLALGNGGSGQSSTINGSLKISGTGVMEVNSGKWRLNNNATLTIDNGRELTIGSVDKDTNPVAAKLNLTKQDSVPAGNLVNNGTVTIKNKGELSLAGIGGLLGTSGTTGKVDVNKGGVLDFGGVESTLLSSQLGSSSDTGKIYLEVGDESLRAGTLIADRLVLGDKNNQFNGGTPGIINVSLSLKDGKGTGITWKNGTLMLGTPVSVKEGAKSIIDGSITTATADSKAGNIVVGNGTWTLASGKTIEIGNGTSLNIGNGSTSATLDISKAGAVVTSGTPYQPLKSGVAGNGTEGINVLNNGTLTANAAQLLALTYTNEVVTGTSGRVSDLNTLYVGTGGRVNLEGIGKIDQNGVTAIKNALFGSSAAGLHGTLDLQKAKITGITNNTIDVATAGNFAGLALSDVRVKDTATDEKALAGEFSSVELGTGGKVKVESGKTLNLVNKTTDGYLIKAGNTAGDLTLADATSTLGEGKVGAVTLTKTSTASALTLNGTTVTGLITAAADAKITLCGTSEVKDITGANSNDTVTVAASATDAKAQEIGKGTQVAKLENEGKLTATSVKATNLTNTGTLKTTGDAGITASNGLTSTGGTIDSKKLSTSSGDVKITGGELKLDGTTTNKSVIGSALTLDKVTAKLGDLEVSKADTAATISGGSFVARKVDFKGGADFKAGAKGTIEELNLDGKTLTIGGDEAAGQNTSLGIYKLDNTSAFSLIVDPSWEVGSAQVWYKGSASTTTLPDSVVINGNVGVGQNSMLTVGLDNNDWLLEQVNAVAGSINSKTGTGLYNGKYKAALGVYANYDIASGQKLVIDGGIDGTTGNKFDFTTAETKTFRQAENTLLVVRGMLLAFPIRLGTTQTKQRQLVP